MTETRSQDYSVSKTWLSDWTDELNQPLLSGVTITGQTVTCPAPPAGCTPTISGGAIYSGSKGVTFRASQTGITTPTVVTFVVGVTLSNGDTDQRNFLIQFTDT